MTKQYGWDSEYKRKKFLENQERRKQKKHVNSSSKIPKTIAIMLDLGRTCDSIDDEKAQIFIAQLEILRKKFKADFATISISTHCNNSNRMQQVLEILSHNLSSYIKIGISFFLGGTYDYDKKEEASQGYSFNYDKMKTFDNYYVNNSEVNNKWFAIIDDGVSTDTYMRYKNSRPMLVCRPSQYDKDILSRNNFMSISTTTKDIEGVIEILNLYIESIKDLSPSQIMETQKNMITHLSSCDLIEKIRNRDYVFLERYFKEGFADDADYRDSLNWLIYSNQMPSKEELKYLYKILELMSQHFQKINEEKNNDEVLKLQKIFAVANTNNQ